MSTFKRLVLLMILGLLGVVGGVHAEEHAVIQKIMAEFSDDLAEFDGTPHHLAVSGDYVARNCKKNNIELNQALFDEQLKIFLEKRKPAGVFRRFFSKNYQVTSISLSGTKEKEKMFHNVDLTPLTLLESALIETKYLSSLDVTNLEKLKELKVWYGYIERDGNDSPGLSLPSLEDFWKEYLGKDKEPEPCLIKGIVTLSSLESLHIWNPNLGEITLPKNSKLKSVRLKNCFLKKIVLPEKGLENLKELDLTLNPDLEGELNISACSNSCDFSFYGTSVIVKGYNGKNQAGYIKKHNEEVESWKLIPGSVGEGIKKLETESSAAETLIAIEVLLASIDSREKSIKSLIEKLPAFSVRQKGIRDPLIKKLDEAIKAIKSDLNARKKQLEAEAAARIKKEEDDKEANVRSALTDMANNIGEFEKQKNVDERTRIDFEKEMRDRQEAVEKLIAVLASVNQKEELKKQLDERAEQVKSELAAAKIRMQLMAFVASSREAKTEDAIKAFEQGLESKLQGLKKQQDWTLLPDDKKALLEKEIGAAQADIKTVFEGTRAELEAIRNAQDDDARVGLVNTRLTGLGGRLDGFVGELTKQPKTMEDVNALEKDLTAELDRLKKDVIGKISDEGKREAAKKSCEDFGKRLALELEVAKIRAEIQSFVARSRTADTRTGVDGFEVEWLTAQTRLREALDKAYAGDKAKQVELAMFFNDSANQIAQTLAVAKKKLDEADAKRKSEEEARKQEESKRAEVLSQEIEKLKKEKEAFEQTRNQKTMEDVDAFNASMDATEKALASQMENITEDIKNDFNKAVEERKQLAVAVETELTKGLEAFKKDHGTVVEKSSGDLTSLETEMKTALEDKKDIALESKNAFETKIKKLQGEHDKAVTALNVLTTGGKQGLRTYIGKQTGLFANEEKLRDLRKLLRDMENRLIQQQEKTNRELEQVRRKIQGASDDKFAAFKKNVAAFISELQKTTDTETIAKLEADWKTGATHLDALANDEAKKKEFERKKQAVSDALTQAKERLGREVKPVVVAPGQVPAPVELQAKSPVGAVAESLSVLLGGIVELGTTVKNAQPVVSK